MAQDRYFVCAKCMKPYQLNEHLELATNVYLHYLTMHPDVLERMRNDAIDPVERASLEERGELIDELSR
jgi:hypothetical protein